MAEVAAILIVGGGIGGLSLATALQERGFRAELVERSPSWRAEGGGILVHANGMRVLHALGLGAAVESAGTVVRRWGFYDQLGNVLCESDLEALWRDVGPCIGVERTKLQEVLLSGAAAVPCRLGTLVTSLVQDGRHVRASFSDGVAADYDLVVGADGISSTVRALTISREPPAYTGHMAWRSLASIGRQDVATLQFLLGDGCFFGLCPVGDGRTYGFGNIAEKRLHDATEDRLARLRTRFAGFGDRVGDYLAAIACDEQIHCAPIEWVELDRWHVGRVVLIGDAAHASSPMMGQGGCMAMEDAWVLAEVLRSEETVESALDVYVRRRRPRVSWVQQESRAVAEGFRLPPAVRNAGLRERGDDMLQRRFSPLIAAP
jgi:2-polyprenyl-6-methoxyphenol hydroxylase-like FAD-dependent oxidoreductase